MRSEETLKSQRILSLVFGTRKMGFSVSYGTDNLIDWGVKHIPGSNKNVAIEKVGKLVEHFQPSLICLQDVNDPQCQLGKPVRDIVTEVSKFASKRSVALKLVSKSEIQEGLCITSPCEKSELLDEIIRHHSDMNFPKIEKRKIWESEAYATPYLMAASFPLSLTKDGAMNE